MLFRSVARDIARQISQGERGIAGVMVESHIEAGAQKFTPGQDDAAALRYGQSITDACLGWSDSQALLALLDEAVRARRLMAPTASKNPAKSALKQP